MSESTIDNYKGKQIVMEEDPNDEWENPTCEDNLILGNYVNKCLSDGPIWYKMGYHLPHKLNAKNILILPLTNVTRKGSSQEHTEKVMLLNHGSPPWNKGSNDLGGACEKISTFYLYKDIYLQVKDHDPAFLI
ncbi:hypothetical protein Tco_1303766 [Tanacetum coccineum]